MSQLLFEQYKDALRRGHVAARQGRLSAAIAAYESAATMAPDRALPHVSRAVVLLRLGRLEDAERAFTTALSRAPFDEAALRGRAQVRVDLRRPLDAARDHEALAEVLERDGRLADACDEVCAALSLAESRHRRGIAERLLVRLRGLADDTRAAAAILRAERALRLSTAPSEPPTGDAPDENPPARPEEPAPPPPLDPVADLVRAFALLESGEVPAARSLLLAVAAAERQAGHLDAALDASLILVAINPADPDVQLEIAVNQVARGWYDLAADKVRLLARLASLDEDESATATIRAFAAAHGLEAGSGGAERGISTAG